MAGIYIHIPFCKSKCNYCDFISFDNKWNYMEQYKNALISEIKNCLELSKVSTVFIGGGTPTTLPLAYIQEILQLLPITPRTECTIEANPGTLEKEYLTGLKQAGINRISLGLQAWQNSHLKRLGRIHDRHTFVKNYQAIADIGIDNVNVDLMFGLPQQSFDEWKETLNNIVNLSPQPKHISIYGLTIEEGTNFYNIQDKLNLPDEETERKMYHFATDYLAQNGYLQYEISNFAKKGYKSEHNCIYWNCTDYLGFGLNAHSYNEGIRFRNTDNLDVYIEANGNPQKLRTDITVVTPEEAMEEFMFLGLRMLEGIDVNTFYERFGVEINVIYGEQIRLLVKNGLLDRLNNKIFLTRKGIDISNKVFVEFLIKNT